MTRELERRHQIELWISWIRLLAVPFAIVEVGFLSDGYPPGYARWAWIATGALAAGAGVIWLCARRELGPRAQTALGYSALAFDIAIVGAFVVIFYAWEPNTPVRQALFLPVAEGAARFDIAGGVIVPFLLAPFLAWGEALRADRFDRDVDLDAIIFPLGLAVLMGLLVGWLAARVVTGVGLLGCRRIPRAWAAPSHDPTYCIPTAPRMIPPRATSTSSDFIDDSMSGCGRHRGGRAL